MKESIAGHVIRHREQLAECVLKFRSDSWWRKRQQVIRPGSRIGRHPGRYVPYNWETPITRKLNHLKNEEIMEEYKNRWGTLPTSWMEIAEERDIWRKYTRTLLSTIPVQKKARVPL